MAGSYKKGGSDIIQAELAKLLRQEMVSGMRAVLDGIRTGANTAPVNIVIHNNTGASVSARETQGPLNQKQLEITIDQMVAQSLLQGRQTGGVLRTLFGLAPSLIGR